MYFEFFMYCTPQRSSGEEIVSSVDEHKKAVFYRRTLGVSICRMFPILSVSILTRLALTQLLRQSKLGSLITHHPSAP
jgi:hypothetical protein